MSDHIVEDEFTNRPDDDDLAFLHYEKLFRAPLERALAALQEPEQSTYWNLIIILCKLTSTACSQPLRNLTLVSLNIGLTIPPTLKTPKILDK